MSQSFDAYEKWFGISASEQPPNYYRLLGLKEFESDPSVIQSAGEKRVEFLQDVSSGRHVNEAQELLNAITKAVICLSDYKKKASYDQDLRKSKLPVAKVTAVSSKPRKSSPKKRATKSVARREPADVSVAASSSPTSKPKATRKATRKATPDDRAKPKAQAKPPAAKRKPTKKKAKAGTPFWFRAGAAVLLFGVIASMIFILVNREKKDLAKSNKDESSYHIPVNEGESSLPSMNRQQAGKGNVTTNKNQGDDTVSDDDNEKFNIPVPTDTATMPVVTNPAPTDPTPDTASAGTVVEDFETWDMEDGAVRTFSSPLGQWDLDSSSTVNFTIDEPEKHLHLTGGEETMATLTLAEAVKIGGTLKIKVERKSPVNKAFEFHVQKNYGDQKWYFIGKTRPSPKIVRRSGAGPEFVTLTYELKDDDIQKIRLICKSEFAEDSRDLSGILISEVSISLASTEPKE